MPDYLELEDPIREVTHIFQKWLLRALLFALLCSAFCVFTNLVQSHFWLFCLAMTILSWFLVVAVASLTLWWRAFAPRRATDVFYLRSFKNDSDTWPIRVEIQRALGSGLRLSGIRDPRRRALGLSEKYSAIFMAMKYCTPRHMDLVAQDDWKGRLWHSLRAAKLAIIDLSTPTPAVREEIQIARDALGMERVAFLGHAPQTADEIRAVLAEELGDSSASGAKNILVWPGKSSRQELEAFRSQISALTKGGQAAVPLAGQTCPEWCGEMRPIGIGQRHADQMVWEIIGFQGALLIAQIILQFAVASAEQTEHEHSFLTALLLGPFVVGNLWFLTQNWFLYVRDVGIPAERVKASIAFAIMMTPIIILTAQWISPLFSTPSARAQPAVTPSQEYGLHKMPADDEADFVWEEQEHSGRLPDF